MSTEAKKRKKRNTLPSVTFGGRDQRIVLNPVAVEMLGATNGCCLLVKYEGGKFFINVKSTMGVLMRNAHDNGFVCIKASIVRQVFYNVKLTLPEEKRNELFALKFEILTDIGDGWHQLSDVPLKMYKR